LPLGETARIVQETKSGLLVSPTNLDEHVAALQMLLANTEHRKTMSIASKAASKLYNFDTELEQLILLYRQIAEALS